MTTYRFRGARGDGDGRGPVKDFENGSKRCSTIHPSDIERWHERNDGTAIQIEKYSGDWSFPRGKAWVVVEPGPYFGTTSITVAHQFHIARAFGGPAPEFLEWMIFDVRGVEPLKALRDRLDEAIRELEAQP